VDTTSNMIVLGHVVILHNVRVFLSYRCGCSHCFVPT